jgi:hypothetical protein
MMRTIRWLIPFLLFGATITGAQELGVSRIDAKEFGIYLSDIEIEESPATEGIGHNRITNVRLVEKTRAVRR